MKRQRPPQGKKIITQIGLKDVSQKTYWQAIKNICAIKRMKKAQIYWLWYLIPYGGFSTENEFNLYKVQYKKY